jgi:hypothetical protein
MEPIYLVEGRHWLILRCSDDRKSFVLLSVLHIIFAPSVSRSGLALQHQQQQVGPWPTGIWVFRKYFII